jgi:nucleotide-binding universal stress UspA family protein
MFSRIVVGTDGSSDATEAVKVAGQLACIAPAGKVHVVTAYQRLTPAQLRSMDKQLPQEFHDQLTGDLVARSALEDAEAILTARGVDYSTRHVNLDPADAVLALAKEVDADVIVVGSRGEGAIDRLRHGSTSTRVMHDADCSVLVVKHAR